MKKIGLILILAVLSATLAFAGGNQARSNVRVDAFWYLFSDTFLASVRNEMTSAFSGGGITLQHHDANNTQATQVQQIQTALTRGTNLLIVNIVTTGSDDAAMTIVELARNANVPLIWFNREVSNAVVAAYDNSVFVGTDANEAGVMQGQAIAEFLLQGDNWTGNNSNFDLNNDGRINYVMFRGEHGNAEAFGRTLYSVQEANRLLAASNRTLVLAPSPANSVSTMYPDDGISNFFLYANWSAAEAERLMGTAMSAHSLTNGAIELIIANNDDAALGAIAAMNQQGFNTGDATRFIPVFGVDATAPAQEAIRGGRMTGTIGQDGAGMATTILHLAQNIANGRALMDNTAQFNLDQGVAKIRVPHFIF